MRWADVKLHLWLCSCHYTVTAIQFVLSDEFTHMRPEERQQLLHVSQNFV